MDQIYPKMHFQLKTEQAVQGLQAFAFCIVKVNWTIVFKNFEDLKELIILSISKVKMISKVMIKFLSKFQFQIPLQFQRTVEKVETCDGNGQKFWQVPPFFQPSRFGCYFVFHDWDSNVLNIKVLYLKHYNFHEKDVVQE